jgi:hypothetical protein
MITLRCLQVNELTKLDMSYNELRELPAELWLLVALNTLLLRCVLLQHACRKHAGARKHRPVELEPTDTT